MSNIFVDHAFYAIYQGELAHQKALAAGADQRKAKRLARKATEKYRREHQRKRLKSAPDTPDSNLQRPTTDLSTS